MKDPMDCTYPNHKLCVSDDCSDECQRQRGSAWRKRQVQELQTHTIDSISTVRLYRNAEGTVIMSEAVERIPHKRILELHEQFSGVELSTFLRVAQMVENEIFLEDSK
jgi:CxxC motif-containing protein